MWPASKPTPEPVTAHSHTSSFRPHKQPVSSMEALNFKHSATRPARLWECGPPPPASSRPLPVKGRRVRAPSGPPFRPFGPVERFPNFRAHWNCRAERDTGHGLAEGPRAAHSRGPGGPRAPRPQPAATPPWSVGGGPGRSGLNGRAGRWGGSGAEEKSAPPTSTGPREPRGDAPRGQASRSRPETLPAGASLPQLHFPPSQENPLPTTTPIGPQPATYTCPQGTCTGFSYTSRHTGHVKRPRGSASAAGPASCAPPSRAGACACAAILPPR